MKHFNSCTWNPFIMKCKLILKISDLCFTDYSLKSFIWFLEKRENAYQDETI